METILLKLLDSLVFSSLFVCFPGLATIHLPTERPVRWKLSLAETEEYDGPLSGNPTPPLRLHMSKRLHLGAGSGGILTMVPSDLR